MCWFAYLTHVCHRQNSAAFTLRITAATDQSRVQGWVEEMGAHLKSVDPNHLVTVGEEGFYALGSLNERLNPGNGWASITGQNFTANHAPDAIDFAAIHLWPDNWEVG